MSAGRQLVVFVSYAREDEEWADWVAWLIEDAGHRAIVDRWDFPEGSNFVEQIDEAVTGSDHTIALLSPHYLQSDYCRKEWTAALADDPGGRQGRLIPVRIELCEPKGLLGSLVYADLVDLAEDESRQRILARLKGSRRKPTRPPIYPGRGPGPRPRFPGRRSAAFLPPCDQSLHFETVVNSGKPWSPDRPTLVTMHFALCAAEESARRLDLHLAFPVHSIPEGPHVKARISVGCTAADVRLLANGAEFVGWHAEVSDPTILATRLSATAVHWAIRNRVEPRLYLAGNRQLWATFSPASPVRIQSTAMPLDRVIYDHRDRRLKENKKVALMARLVKAKQTVPPLEALEQTVVVEG